VLAIRRSKLYYTASGIVTPVGGHPVHSPLSNTLQKIVAKDFRYDFILTILLYYFGNILNKYNL